MRILLSAVILAGALRMSAQEQPHHAGNKGDRLGTAHLQTSCSPSVTAQFDRALTLLHSFEFGPAIKGFQDVLSADSTCSMANWGIALSRWSNPMAVGNRSPDQLRLGSLAVDAANRVASHATDREREYITAVAELYKDPEHVTHRNRVIAYERAMAELVAKQPADTEAKIFYAISLAASASPTDKTYANQLKAGSILEPLWVKQPDHPGLAHYIIHTYDYPALASKAEVAARTYSSIAPSAAHALHMPSHIFTRTGMWQKSIETNLRSVDIASGTGSIAEVLHASDYAEYAYLQLRRYADAKRILLSLPVLDAKFDVNAVTGAAPGAAGVFALAAIPARYALERDAWSEAAQLVPKPSSFPWTEAMTYFARSLGASRSGDRAKARLSIDSLIAIQARLTARGETYWAEQVAIQAVSANAWLLLAEKRSDSALAQMRQAVSREGATEKNSVTPGPLAPARELLGDMLMALHRPSEALVEYQKTVLEEPNRYRTLAGGVRAAKVARNKHAENEFRSRLKATGLK